MVSSFFLCSFVWQMDNIYWGAVKSFTIDRSMDKFVYASPSAMSTRQSACTQNNTDNFSIFIFRKETWLQLSLSLRLDVLLTLQYVCMSDNIRKYVEDILSIRPPGYLLNCKLSLGPFSKRKRTKDWGFDHETQHTRILI